MSDQKLLNKAITISAKEEKLQAGKPVVKLKDEKGLTYTVYKTKQDGSTSVAWEQLSELDLEDTVQIGYVEDIKDSPEYGKVTYRTIRSFNKDIGIGMANAAAQAQTARTEAPSASGSPSETFWDKKAYKQCLWGFFLNNNSNEPLTTEEMDLVWNTFKSIEMDADKRFSVSEPKATEPTIHVDGFNIKLDEDLAKDVPF